jgi:chloramphenicol 3-O-phosphotransferase
MTGKSPTHQTSRSSSVLLLLGGPAGAGKSTLARAWCAARARAAHIQLDEMRHLIVAGRADPQQPGSLQSEQHTVGVRACLALAHTFVDGGYDVAVDDVLEPAAFERDWRPLLHGLDWRVVIVLPDLEQVLRRSRAREKRVLEAHSRAQHAACAGWPAAYCVDTTGLSVEESLALVRRASGT